MGFMNLNQSAHGDREYGFIVARLRLDRKIVVGHWQDAAVARRARRGSRVACSARVAQAEDRALRRHEHARGRGDRRRPGGGADSAGVVDERLRRRRSGRRIAEVRDAEVDQLVEEYEAQYRVAPGARGGRRRARACATPPGRRSAPRLPHRGAATAPSRRRSRISARAQPAARARRASA